MTARQHHTFDPSPPRPSNNLSPRSSIHHHQPLTLRTAPDRHPTAQTFCRTSHNTTTENTTISKQPLTSHRGKCCWSPFCPLPSHHAGAIPPPPPPRFLPIHRARPKHSPGSLPSSRPLPLSCPNPSGCRLWLAASEGQSAKSPGPSDLTKRPEARGFPRESEAERPTRTHLLLAGQALVNSSEDGPDDSVQEGGRGPGDGRFPTVPSILPAPLPASLWAISPGIHGAMVIDEGGGHLLVRRPGCELGFTPRCCLQCPLPAARCPLPTVGPRCQAQAPWGRPALSRSPLDLAASTNARARPKAGVWSPPHCPVIPRHRLT